MQAKGGRAGPIGSADILTLRGLCRLPAGPVVVTAPFSLMGNSLSCYEAEVQDVEASLGL